MARASWKLCSISGAQTPSASPPETSLSSSNSLESYLAICCESSPGRPGILMASLPCMLYWAGWGDLELVFCSMSVLVEGSEVELVPPQLVRELLRARGWGAAPHSRLGTDREIVRLWRLAGRDGSGNRNIVVIIIIVIIMMIIIIMIIMISDGEMMKPYWSDWGPR